MWKLRSEDRLSYWKNFRRSLDEKSIEQALEETAKFWQTSPFAPYYLDPSKPKTWPDPWTLIQENYYCDLARCLGMLYTVFLSGHRPTDLEIRIYYDSKNRRAYNLLLVEQGKYVLNMVDGKVLNTQHISNELEIKFKYLSTELNLNSY